MRYRGLTVFFLIIALYFISVSIIKESYTCDQKIIYKYIPRTFEEDQNQPILPSQIFKKMFDKPSPWVDSIGTYDRKNQDKINQYFISQS